MRKILLVCVTLLAAGYGLTKAWRLWESHSLRLRTAAEVEALRPQTAVGVEALVAELRRDGKALNEAMSNRARSKGRQVFEKEAFSLVAVAAKDRKHPDHALARGIPGRFDALLWAARHDDKEMRKTAIIGLGRIPGLAILRDLQAEAVPVIARALEDPDRGIQNEAISRLERFRDMWDRGGVYPPSIRPAVPQLLRTLDHEDAKMRVRAVKLLSRTQVPKEGIPTLVRALKDEDAEVRKNAIRAVQRAQEVLGPDTRQAAISALETVLSDPDPAVRSSAVDTLVALGPDGKTLSIVRKGLEYPDPGRRIEAVKLLGKLGAVRGLVEALKDRDAKVRRQAADALGRCVQSLSSEIIHAVRDVPNPMKPVHIGHGFYEKQLDEELEAALNDVKISVVTPCVRTVPRRNFSRREINEMIELLGSEDEAQRARAVEGLKAAGSAAARPLIESLRSADRDMKLRILPVLNEPDIALDDACVAKYALYRAMTDEDKGVRREAVRSLEKGIGYYKGLYAKGLESVRQRDVSARVRFVSALEKAFWGWGLDALEEALTGDPHPRVRAEAARVFGRIRFSRDALEKAAVEDPDSTVRAEAVKAVGRYSAAIPTLKRALRDTNPRVRSEAAAALERLGKSKKKAVRSR